MKALSGRTHFLRNMVLAVALAFVLMVGLSIAPGNLFAGVAQAVDYTYDVNVTSGSPPLDTQEIVVTFTYDGTPFAGGPYDLTSDFDVFLVDRNVVTSIAYTRDLDVTASGNELTVTIGSRNGGMPAFTAQFCGRIEIIGNNLSTFGVDDIHLKTIAPLGEVAFETVQQGGWGTASITITEIPNVRGILNIGIYKKVGNKLVPIDTTLNGQLETLSPLFNNKVNAYIAHFPDFGEMPVDTTAGVADRIVESLTGGSGGGMSAVEIADGYTISASDSTLTVTGPAYKKLYMYIFDDRLIQELGTDFDTIANASPSGKLPSIPSPSWPS